MTNSNKTNTKLPESKPASCSRCGEFYVPVDPEEYIAGLAENDQRNINPGVFERLSQRCPKCIVRYAQPTEFSWNSSNYSSRRFTLWFTAEHMHLKTAIQLAISCYSVIISVGLSIFVGFFIGLWSHSVTGWDPSPTQPTFFLKSIPGLIGFSVFVLQSLLFCSRNIIKDVTTVYPIGSQKNTSWTDVVLQHVTFSFTLLIVAALLTLCYETLMNLPWQSTQFFLCLPFCFCVCALAQWLFLGVLIPDFATHDNFSLQRLQSNIRNLKFVTWVLPFALFAQGLLFCSLLVYVIPGLLFLGLLLRFHVCFYIAYFGGREPNNFVMTHCAQIQLDYIELVKASEHETVEPQTEG